MATVTARIDASPDAVFAVLADGWVYSGWVVGASHMRAVEDAWPAAGSRLHHSSGAWPLTVDDETRVEAVEPGRHLTLLAKGGALGQARVDLTLAADGDGTIVTMSEEPVSGPGHWFHNPLADDLLRRRNTETLARLRALVERPTTPRK